MKDEEEWWISDDNQSDFMRCILDQMFVFFPDEPKIGIKTIKTYCQRMQEENIHRAIICVQQGMTPSAKQVRRMVEQSRNSWMRGFNLADGKVDYGVINYNAFICICWIGSVARGHGPKVHLGAFSWIRIAHQYHGARVGSWACGDDSGRKTGIVDEIVRKNCLNGILWRDEFWNGVGWGLFIVWISL
jgi:hypothetical protein